MILKSICPFLQRRFSVTGFAKKTILLILVCLPVAAQDFLTPRIQIGVSLFPSIVAAVKNLADQVNPDQQLNIYLVYQKNDLLAQKLKQKLISKSTIKNYPIAVTLISQSELIQLSKPVKGVLFISEPANGDFQALTNFAQINRILSFSPFKGDVERGVATGYQVTDKVLPLVNTNSLKNANIQLKPFFLRIAVKYE